MLNKVFSSPPLAPSRPASIGLRSAPARLFLQVAGAALVFAGCAVLDTTHPAPTNPTTTPSIVSPGEVPLSITATTTPVTTTPVTTTPVTTIPVTTEFISECPDEPLTLLPVEAAAIVGVVPLGNLNPPGHTQPTDHVYLWLSGSETGWPSDKVLLVAPGPGTIIRIGRMTNTSIRGEFTDFSLTIEICPGREIKLGHISSLSAALIDNLRGHHNCHEYGYADENYEFCSFDTQIEVEAGKVLGTAGGRDTRSIALDLWAIDWSEPAATFINEAAVHDEMRYAVCPLDWFVAELQAALYEGIFAYTGVSREHGVDCGTIAQDVPGTAKGLWYLTIEGQGDWEDQLALVDHNARAVDQAISVASTVADSGVWVFERRQTGTVNRDFGEVLAGSGIYCYEGFTDRSSGTRPGDAFLIEVIDSDTLRIERWSGVCRNGYEFDTPVVYRR